MELEVQWQEHELGSYPAIVLLWEDAMGGTPWSYTSRCEAALTAYENGGELPPGSTAKEEEPTTAPVNCLLREFYGVYCLLAATPLVLV